MLSLQLRLHQQPLWFCGIDLLTTSHIVAEVAGIPRNCKSWKALSIYFLIATGCLTAVG